MKRKHYKLLETVRAAGGTVEFSGADAVVARELENRGMIVRWKPEAFGDDESVFACAGITPAGYVALDKWDGMVLGILLRHGGKIFYAVLTAALCYAASRLAAGGGVKAFLDSLKRPSVGLGVEVGPACPEKAPAEENVENAD